MTARATSQAIARLQEGEVLDRAELAEAFLPVLAETFTGADVAWGALFGTLHARGATAGEALGLVDAILAFDPELADQLEQKVALGIDRPVVAITGSGKESFKTFNVSTAAAFVAAAHPGICVIKPAGRATSATTGASDVLEALGIRLPKSLDEVSAMALRSRVGVFDYHLVAPRYGPRYEGRFHHLHPLSHVTPWLFIPIRIDGLVFGVAEPRVELAASVMAASGVDHAAVVSTQVAETGRIDEYAPFGTADLAVLDAGAVRVEHHKGPDPTPMQLLTVAQRRSNAENAAIVRDVLRGRAPEPAIELVCANAGLVLQVAGLAADHRAGRALARDLIHSGEAFARLAVCRDTSQQLG